MTGKQQILKLAMYAMLGGFILAQRYDFFVVCLISFFVMGNFALESQKQTKANALKAAAEYMEQELGLSGKRKRSTPEV